MRAEGDLRMVQPRRVARGMKDWPKKYVGEGDNDRPEDSEPSDGLPPPSTPAGHPLVRPLRMAELSGQTLNS